MNIYELKLKEIFTTKEILIAHLGHTMIEAIKVAQEIRYDGEIISGIYDKIYNPETPIDDAIKYVVMQLIDGDRCRVAHDEIIYRYDIQTFVHLEFHKWYETVFRKANKEYDMYKDEPINML